MALLDLEMAKRHLRVDFSDDDFVIDLYLGAAERSVTEYLDRVVLPEGTDLPGEEDEGYDETAMLVNPAIQAAILLITSHLYENRESVVDSKLVELPMGVRFLLAPWRVWRTFEEDLPEYPYC